MDKQQHVLYIDPSELSVHPDAKKMPEWPNDHEEFLALVDDIADRGINHPILIDAQNRIVDGRHRVRAAKRLQLKLVPALVRNDNEVAGIIIGTVLHRRHYSAGARAYLACPLMEKALKEAQQRKLECLKQGPKCTNALRDIKTVADLADAIGVSRRLFFQAQELHKAFEDKPDLREQFEDKILAGEVGLGGCIAGIAGQESTKDKPKPKEDQLELFTETFDTLKKRFKYWQKFSAEEKQAALGSIIETFKGMPADLRTEVKKFLNKLEKEEKSNG